MHNFGLEDEYTKAEKDRPKQNYMDNCYVANPGITRDQLIKAINSEHNLYSNYSNASEITEKNWYDTSNSDPENSATKGKDGKVPKIIADPK